MIGGALLGGLRRGKGLHWVCVLDGEGEVVLSRRVEATERDLEACCEEVAAFGSPGDRKVGLDLVGGPATLLQAVLLGGGERLFHISGMAVNRARDGYRGENKSDARDARVIADQLRLRRGALQEVRPREEATAELRLLVAHRRDLLQDQTRRAARLREVLLGVFPGLEAALDFKREGALLAVTKVASPAAAKARRRELPSAEAKAALVAEIASEVLCASGSASPSSTVVWRSCWRRCRRRRS